MNQSNDLMAGTAKTTTADGTPPAGGPGSREHVRATIAHVREAIETARSQAALSRGLFVRAGLASDTSEHAVRQSLELRAEIQAAVIAYVQRLKSDGLPSERMLVLVKSAVQDAIPRDLDPDEVRTLLADVVRWSVEAYYPAA